MTGQSRASRMSRKFVRPTKVKLPLWWAKRLTPAPTVKGRMTSAPMPRAAGAT